MAITFNPLEKVIELDSYSVSERQIWTAFVDWSVEGDNLKYGVGMTQLGGLAPVALYIFLAEGWRVRPLALAGITTITGNLLTSNNESPIEQAENVVQVNMETPVQAVALNSGGTGSGASVADVQSIINEFRTDFTRYTDSALPKIREIAVDTNHLTEDLADVPAKIESIDKLAKLIPATL